MNNYTINLLDKIVQLNYLIYIKIHRDGEPHVKVCTFFLKKSLRTTLYISLLMVSDIRASFFQAISERDFQHKDNTLKRLLMEAPPIAQERQSSTRP